MAYHILIGILKSDRIDMVYNFIPAKLTVGKVWYISWTVTDPDTLERKRFKRTFGLNRLASKRMRRTLARKYIQRINQQLLAGVQEFAQEQEGSHMTIESAMEMAMNRKRHTCSEKTLVQYASLSSQFLEWIEKTNCSGIPVNIFSKGQARDFFDYLLMSRKVTGKTMNNYLITMKSLFYEMYRSDIIQDNPFTHIPKFRESRKIRRSFTGSEKSAVVNHLQRHDPWCLLAVSLVYYCLIRPAELRRLHIQFIDLDQGVIFLPGSITKNGDDALVTIPDSILDFLKSYKLHEYGGSWYLFGATLRPHPNKQCGSNTMNYRHRQALIAVQRAGHIKDIKGLSLYSWKDTADQELIKSGVDLLTVKDHNRHKSLETTNNYVQRRPQRLAAIANSTLSLWEGKE